VVILGSMNTGENAGRMLRSQQFMIRPNVLSPLSLR
jgi:hypothetical protein